MASGSSSMICFGLLVAPAAAALDILAILAHALRLLNLAARQGRGLPRRRRSLGSRPAKTAKATPGHPDQRLPASWSLASPRPIPVRPGAPCIQRRTEATRRRSRWPRRERSTQPRPRRLGVSNPEESPAEGDGLGQVHVLQASMNAAATSASASAKSAEEDEHGVEEGRLAGGRGRADGPRKIASCQQASESLDDDVAGRDGRHRSSALSRRIAARRRWGHCRRRERSPRTLAMRLPVAGNDCYISRGTR